MEGLSHTGWGGCRAPLPLAAPHFPRRRWGVETWSAFSAVLFLDLSILPGQVGGRWGTCGQGLKGPRVVRNREKLVYVEEGIQPC